MNHATLGSRFKVMAVGQCVAIVAFLAHGSPAQSIARQTYQHSLAVASDGTAWSWGRNDYGQLGIGTAGNDQSSPLPVVGLSNIVAARSGLEHSLFLRGDGTVWVTGRNDVGQLGNGTTGDSATAVQVLGINNAIAVAGLDHSCLALLSDGTVRAWGDNSTGIFGAGIGPGSNVPVQVPNLTGIVAIEGGAYHGIALRNDGVAYTWGGNSNGGPLGNGAPSGTDGIAPAPVVGLFDVVSISAGTWNCSALRSDGTVWTWGSNAYGQLGRGTLSTAASPVPGLTNVAQIAGGSYHVLARRIDGTVSAWGYNYFGEIGNGTTANVGSPVLVSGLSNVIEIAAGSYHSIARLVDGSLRSWGRNVEGELGNNTVGTIVTAAVPVIGLTLPTSGSGCSSSVAGQPNSLTARLEINGCGAGTAPGPFIVPTAPLQPLTFAWQGAPLMPMILISGPLRPTPYAVPGSGGLPGLGLVHLGFSPTFTDITIIFDGAHMPGGLQLTTSPTGTAAQTVIIPAGTPPGTQIAVQGIVEQVAGTTTYGNLLTAAFRIDVL